MTFVLNTHLRKLTLIEHQTTQCDDPLIQQYTHRYTSIILNKIILTIPYTRTLQSAKGNQLETMTVYYCHGGLLEIHILDLCSQSAYSVSRVEVVISHYCVKRRSNVRDYFEYQ